MVRKSTMVLNGDPTMFASPHSKYLVRQKKMYTGLEPLEINKYINDDGMFIFG